MHVAVAITSLLLPTDLIIIFLPERHAAIISLCAYDLDGGAVKVPQSLFGVIQTFI